MPKMRVSERNALPASAFAYIDPRGRRSLPIHDAEHVRAALARFGHIPFESDAGREKARRKLLMAAARHGIMPLGFITTQIGRDRAATSSAPRLPSGTVTFLLSDIEASTDLVHRLGDRYADLIDAVRAQHRDAVAAAAGHEVDARADEYFAVFDAADAAVAAALAIQAALASRAWPDGLTVRVRMGIHTGHPTLATVGYVGLDVHVAARVSARASGGQILLSAATYGVLSESVLQAHVYESLGAVRLRGIPSSMELYQLVGRAIVAADSAS